MFPYICHYFLDKFPYDELLGQRREEVECGKDFCDSCGDCLDCYGGGPCYHGVTSSHFFVRYVTREEWEKIKDLPEAAND